MGKIGLSGVSGGGESAALPSGFRPSPQQQAIFDHTQDASRGNLIVEARAGTGKTTTLVETATQLHGGAAFLAFNKAIASEIERKLGEKGLDWKQVAAKTFHSVGFQAWKKHKGGADMRGEKLSLLQSKIEVPKPYLEFSRSLVSLAKQACVGIDSAIDDDTEWMRLVEHHSLAELAPEGVDDLEDWLENGLAWSLRLLRQSIRDSDTVIDFDDMIYMPLLEGLKFWQYAWVMVDEAQDTNFARRTMARRLVRPGGRLIAVGDRHQAIYGFTGADSDALDLIERDFRADLLPLTMTYRCASSIVTLAQQWVPDIEARPDAPEGVVRTVPFEEFAKHTPEPTDAILCRLTAPLVMLAFGYLRRHVPCHVEGREIGGALISFIKRFKVNDISTLMLKMQEHLDKERDRLVHQHKHAQLAQLEDKIDTILVLAESLTAVSSPQALIDLINSMFKDSENLPRKTITLSTVHKAKGREWDRVFLLGRSTLMPSSWAKQEWELVQERNLMYVAVTRARNELVDVELPRRGGRRGS